MRPLYVVSLLVALVGCGPTRAQGSFASQGVSDGELDRDDLAFACDDEQRCRISGVVCSVDATSVHFCFTQDRSRGYRVARAQVIPAQRLAAGMLVEVNNSRDWVRVSGIAKDGVMVDGATLPVPWKDVTVLTSKAPAYDQHVRRFETTAGALLLLLAIGMIVFARRLQKRARDHERHATSTDRDDDTSAPAVVDDKLEVLRCLHCATPIKLVAEPHTSCPGCGKQVDIPPAYVDLVTKQRYIAERLPAQAAALRRARIMAHPLIAVVMLAAGWGSWRAFGWMLRNLTSGSGDSGAFWIITSFPLFYVPIGCVVAAIGQLSGGRALGRAVPELAAVKDDHGYACRGCGAPLGATKDGVAEVCVYCGVQNLIASRLAASRAAATRAKRGLRRTLSVTSASFWYRFDRLFVPPLYVAGVIGLILYPFILWAGLTT